VPQSRSSAGGGPRNPGPRPDTTGAVAPPSPSGSVAGHRRPWWSPLDAATALLVLRAFLGVTFVFAALQKLANPDFFRASAPGSIQEQLRFALHGSPVPELVRPALHAPVVFGVAIALAELAVGLGTLLGLYSRVAAIGGMALSLTFFLTISFNTWPYYYGADIVFVFAWSPFFLSAPSPWSLDAAIARAARRPARVAPAAPGFDDVSRRDVVRKGAVAGILAAAGLTLAAFTAMLGRALKSPQATALGPMLGGATTPTTGPGSSSTSGGVVPTTTAGAARPKGTQVGPASDIPVGGAAQFTDPADGSPAFALQLTAGHFTALSAVCTHEGCLVQFEQADDTFHCPCHGSVFDARTGDVLNGPAPSPLPSIKIAEGPNGNLYVNG
jgi:thiosulfate dehydrogenase (quinone) large subunit